MSWVVLPEWHGEIAFLLGCGPSLSEYRYSDVNALHRHGRVIAINDAYMLAPRADVLYACDKKWWAANQRFVENRFVGRYQVTLDNQIDGVKSLRNTGPVGLELDPAGLRNGSNSGYQAINLAYHFGVNRIVLLGYDMRTHGAKLHWRERSDMQNEAGFTQTLQQHMLPKFPTLVEPLAAAGVTVVNATPRSALKVWPFVPLNEILANADNKDFWGRLSVSSHSKAGD